MGLFDELDIAGAADNPWTIPDNTYPFRVTDLEVKKNGKGDMAMYFHFTITEGEHKDFEITEYKRLPSSQDANQLSEAEKSKAMSYIKLRLASLGIPEARMNGVTREDLVGIEGYVSTKVKDGFVNVRDINLTASDDVVVSSPADPFAV